MLEGLKSYLQSLSKEGIALAFSGGVDSSLLLKVLADLYHQKAFPLAILTMHTVLQNDKEIDEAKAFACDLGLDIKLFSFNPFELKEVQHNQKDRCYHCKKAIFSQFAKYAKEQGLKYLLDGTNADDLNVYRPGRRALQELGVISPLAKLGITKAEIRQMSLELGLKTATKPAVPCMATRFEYDTFLDNNLIERVTQGEEIIKKLFPNIKDIRLRAHNNGKLARIEVSKDNLREVSDRAPKITNELKNLGFEFITLDLEGFRSGSFDTKGKDL